MWFQRVLLGYCAASLAVTVVTASITKDATVPARQQIVESLFLPSLERRQQSFTNQTSSSEIIKSTSSVAEISSALKSSDLSQSSTVSSTPVVITPVLTSSPTPTPSKTDLSSILSKSTSGNGGSSSISEFAETKSSELPPASSTTEQQPSATSATSQSSSAQFTTSSTIIDTTSIISSLTTAEPFSSSTLEISSSAPKSTSEQTPATSAEAISSTEKSQVSSTALESTKLTSETIATPPSESMTSTAAIETGSSTVLVSSSQTSASETSSMVFIPSIGLTSQSTPTSSTSVGQQLSTSSSTSTNDQRTSSGIPEPTISTLFEVSTSLLLESLSTSLSKQTSESTSFPALSSTGSLVASSSSVGEILSTSAPGTTTMLVTSTEESSTSTQAMSTSIVSSSLDSSAIEPIPTSMVETPLPSPLPSSPETTVILTTSSIQSSLSLSSEQSLPGSLTESTPVISDALSTSVPPLVPSSQTATITSSIQSSMMMVPSSIQTPSSSLIESTSVFSDFSSTLSLFTNPSELATTTGITSDAESSVAIATSSPAIILPTQSGPPLSETGTPISSVSGIILTDLGNVASTSLSPVVTPSLTFELPIESSTLEATSSREVATGSSSLTELPVSSLETIILSSATRSSGVFSSFVPSETLFSSASVVTTSVSQTLIDTSQDPSTTTSKTVGTQPSLSGQPLSATSNIESLASSTIPASESQAAQNQTSSILEPSATGVSSFPIPTISTSVSRSFVSGSQALSSQNPTSIDAPSWKTTATGPIPTSESSASSSGLGSNSSSSGIDSLMIPNSSGISPLASFGTTTVPLSGSPFPTSVASNSTQTGSGIVTATFSTVYVSTIRSSAFDLSTVAFSLLDSVTGVAINQTDSPVSNTRSTKLLSAMPGTWVPASETLQSSGKPNFGANSTWLSASQPSLSTSTSLPGPFSNSTISKTEFGITLSRSALPTGITSGTGSAPNATQAETAQTSFKLDPAHSSISNSTTSTVSGIEPSVQTDILSSTSASGSETASATDSADTDNKNTLVVPHTPTSTQSQTVAAGSPPPLTTSQTAGIAVGGTTCLLIAVVAAVFIARRYHAAKHGKRMSTGSVYPKVAYLYDPKTGGDGGDTEALMSGANDRMPPGDLSSRAIQGSSKHMQRHSTGTIPFNRFTNPGNPFNEPVRDPAVHRYSEYARRDTARALSAAVAGYANAPRHSSSYTKYPSNSSNAFSDHIIPSPTFSPFSPDDIRRPELKRPQNTSDRRGDYSQMSINPYAYLNTAASMYPPISPYGRPSSQGPSPSFDTRRQTIDSDPFADPFEHDLLLQVDERNRTSDSVTIFAPSPNLMSPRTLRTPVGPKLPIRQPNSTTSARSLLSPVAAKYMHKAQEVKIPHKSIASPVLVQVGRSPVIKPFSPPPAAPEPLGWEEIKRHSEKRFSDERSVPAPLKFTSPVVKKKPVPSSHTRTKPSLTGAGQALLAGNGLPLTVKIPHMYNKSIGLDVPRLHGNRDAAHEDVSSDPVVREKRSRELQFADPALIGKEF